MSAEIQPLVESLLVALYLVALNTVALLLFINALDDAFIDCIYVFRRIYRALFVLPRYGRSDTHSLASLRRPQQAFAICVPAWDESNVIAAMLERAVRDIRYDNYRIYVGIYDNDPATRAAVDDLLNRNPDCRHRIIAVRHRADGPTSKADCLNTLYSALTAAHDWAGPKGLAGVVLHDAEDIVHPSELVVFNHLITKADIIQLPVTPLPRPLHNLVGGHYLDEFAESHTKDLVVREALGCALPSAGVGCAFSTEALASLAMLRGGAPFNPKSVTEDYDIALDLAQQGFSSVFVRLPSRLGAPSYVATQEYFPDTFGAAVTQKARWLLGIALNGWEDRGWGQSWVSRYMLWRDRKALLTALSATAAYVLALVYLMVTLIMPGRFGVAGFEALVPSGGILYGLLLANLVFLASRVIQRIVFVYRSYGLAQALVSPVRIVVGNLINFCASLRAVRLFLADQNGKKRQLWHKTSHQIPGAEEDLALPGGR